jgi:zinicin-like metallopeptidase
MCRTADAYGSAGVLSRTRRKKVCDSRLAPDGTEHEIDLNAEHHWALRDALARRYLAAINGVFLICRTGQEAADQVRRTVIHEIAHHFGIDDERLTELGW